MLDFIKNNIGSIAVLAVVVALLAFLTVSLIRSKRRGSSCSCGCSGCPMSARCSIKKE